MNPVDGVMANFVPYVTRLEAGPASIVASSGGMNLAASFLASGDGLGLRLGVGLGNTVDVGFAEVLDFLAEDDVDEGHRPAHRGRRRRQGALRSRWSRVRPRKPVVVLKVGRSDVTELPLSHTGRLIGDFVVTRVVLAQAGAVIVDDVGQLVDAMRALVMCRIRAIGLAGVSRRRHGLSWAGSVHHRRVAQPCVRRALLLSESTVKGLHGLLPPLTMLTNPVDTGRPSETFGQVLSAVAADDEIDALVVYALERATRSTPRSVGTPGVGGPLPVVFGMSGPREMLELGRRALDVLGVPQYPTPEQAAEPCARSSRTHVGEHAETWPSRPQWRPLLRCPDVPLDEHLSKQLLEALGVVTPARRRAPSAAQPTMRSRRWACRSSSRCSIRTSLTRQASEGCTSTSRRPRARRRAGRDRPDLGLVVGRLLGGGTGRAGCRPACRRRARSGVGTRRRIRQRRRRRRVARPRPGESLR